MDMTLDICCQVTQSAFLSSLHFPSPPYHIALLDLLALCWCPCASSCPLFLRFCPSWRSIQLGKTICRMLLCCLFMLLVFSLRHPRLPLKVLSRLYLHHPPPRCIFFWKNYFSSYTFPSRREALRSRHLHPSLFTLWPLWVHCFAISSW